MKKWNIYIVIILGILSCTKEGGDIPDIINEERIEVECKIYFPAENQQASMDGITANEAEYLIRSLDVLAFRIKENGEEEFDYHSEAKSITPGENPDELKFTVSLLKSADSFCFVIIANASDELDNTQAFVKGRKKEDVMADLLFFHQEEWETPDDSQFTPFPMWGESVPTAITETSQTISRIKLLRMVSRIDVTLSEQAAKDVFVLKTVRLYNRKTRGRLVPFTDPLHYDSSKNEVKKASVPEEDIPGNPLTIQKPSTFYPIKQAGDFAINHIYTFEAAEPALSDRLKATCLVIGGIYKNRVDETFYRVDFISSRPPAPAVYKDILRNYHYTVNITNVLGDGYKTPDQAFEGESMNIIGEILEWSEGGTNSIIFFGPHFLALDRTDVLLGRKSGSKVIREMETNIPVQEINLEFMDEHNGIARPIASGNGIENDRFRINIIQTPEEEITHLEVTALAAYNTGSQVSNEEYVKITGYQLQLTLRIEQLNKDISDWNNGGDYEAGF